MKKRLLSMLMAVLMIASLVPAVALADSTITGHANCDVTTVNIGVDPAAKQAGIEFAYCKTHDTVVKELKVTPFADKAAQNKCAALGHNFKAVELQAADCEDKGITITICADCGVLLENSYKETEATGHVWGGFTAYVKPNCENDGWGYAICQKCKNPQIVVGYEKNKSNGQVYTALGLLHENEKYTSAQEAALKTMFAATNPGHANKDALVVADKDVYTSDNLGNQTLKYQGAVKPTHPETVGWTTGGNLYNNYVRVYEATVSDDGSSVSFTQKLADPTLGGGQGKTGDAYCPDCGVIPEGCESQPVIAARDLSAEHKAYMSIKSEADKGYYPYVDALGKHDGKTDRVWCDKCGKYFGGTVLPFDEYYNPYDTDALTIGQTFTIPQVDATCQSVGHTAIVLTWGKTNGVEGWTVTSAGKEIPEKPHHFVKAKDIAPGCNFEDEDSLGYKFDNLYVCDNVLVDSDGVKHVCNTVKDANWGQVQIVYPNHITGATYVTEVVVEPTCSTNGLSVKYCSVCKEYVDKYIVPAVSHVAGDPVNAKEATCTEVGYTGDTYCKWCNTAMEKGKEIPMKEHTVVDVAAVAATCTEAGATAGTKCSVCGTVLSGCEKIDALGHKYENGVCTVCGEKDPNYKPEVKNPFTDVKEGDAFYEDILWAADKNIVDGIKADDGTMTFQANGKLTRAQVVQMLWNANGKPEAKAAADFSDVAADAWYAKAVAWAVEAGVINGMGDGTFAPNAECTRAQFVKMLWVINGSPKADAADFSDVAADAWYAQAVAWAAAQEVTLGDGEGHFLPGDSCTRGQAVAFLHRAPSLTVTAAE